MFEGVKDFVENYNFWEDSGIGMMNNLRKGDFDKIKESFTRQADAAGDVAMVVPGGQAYAAGFKTAAGVGKNGLTKEAAVDIAGGVAQANGVNIDPNILAAAKANNVDEVVANIGNIQGVDVKQALNSGAGVKTPPVEGIKI